jgi:hypothetical protein
MIAFETFLDLTLLDNEAGSLAGTPDVQAGDEFELDLQQGTGVLQDSLGNIPAELPVSTTPEPATGFLVIGGLSAVWLARRRKA